MKVIVASTAGFCKGVKDAMEITLEAIQAREDGEKICTYGPLIHNRQVLEMLESKGIKEESRLENCAGKKVVIRAHGIPPSERQRLREIDATLLDATCKRVARVHAVIKRHARRGYHTVIVGDADHAEVIGLMGYTEGLGVVINRPEQVMELPVSWDKVLLVAQTTQNEEIFEQIRKAFEARYPLGIVKKTICDSTHERQAEVRRLCSMVDAMVVVGGFHSGNTVRLAEVARECGIPTYHVETEADLIPQEMARYETVGVSAGASTPNWIIQDVVHFLESVRPETQDGTLRFKRTLEHLVYGNVLAALGAALLSGAVQALTGLPVSVKSGLIAALYVFAMHSLNIYLDRNAIQLNNPGRAVFYFQRQTLFTWAGVLAVVGLLALALGKGFMTFAAMAFLVAAGSLYAIPLPSWLKSLQAIKIKDIPTSKTLLIPLAWAAVTTLVPILPHLPVGFGRMLYAFWVVFLMVVIRTALMDFLAVQGDRLVGKETLVVMVGEKRAARYVVGILVLLAISLIAGPMTGASSGFACLALPVTVAYGGLLSLCVRKQFMGASTFEAMVESVLIAVGMIALGWNAVA
ncbi:MAG: 4-hydroxy-3-methylbut-2-enyl diphosphate reductase [Deltaproteobacteria bacterium]|nr:4-hydroxy-3-methylbut-2-enyl diphosphate reductase [Deltaproteobacteria bacterium]